MVGHLQSDLEPEQRLLAGVVRRALKDARGKDQKLKAEALGFLWVCVPDWAERLRLEPAPAEYIERADSRKDRTMAEEDQIVPGTGETAKELARIYGLDVRFVAAAADPAAEKLAERRDFAARYGVDVRFVNLPEEGAENDNG